MQLQSAEFKGYLPSCVEETEAAVKEGLIILDTNVLLQLYRVPKDAQDSALNALNELSARLWMPHQVAREFWMNRISTLQRLNPVVADVKSKISDFRNSVYNILKNDLSQHSSPDLHKALDGLIDQMINVLEGYSDPDFQPKDWIFQPENDPVLTRLKDIFGDNVGDALEDEDDLIQEGLRRFSLKIPPGFEDAKSKADQPMLRGTGDFLLWEQVLRHVKKLNLHTPFVIVTADAKDDWVLKSNSKIVGPHPELIRESLARTGVAVCIVTPKEFWTIVIGETSTSESHVQALGATQSEDDEDQMWTVDAYRKLLKQLIDEGYVGQALCIQQASRNSDGYISREDLYRVTGYDPDRSLRKFRSPADRIYRQMINGDELPQEAEPPLWPRYEGPGQVIGYQVPLEFATFAEEDEQA